MWTEYQTRLDIETSELRALLSAALAGDELEVQDITRLLSVRGSDVSIVIRAADELRERLVGNIVTYVKNRNLNFTNICTGSCRFCAFRRSLDAPDAYVLSEAQIRTKVREARDVGATEVCVQGGLHPDFGLQDYIKLLHIIREVAPQIHIHAFSPAEIDHICKQEGMEVSEVLTELRNAGLDSMPGTAAEILVDRVRALICPEKISAKRWIEIIRTAHELGIPTTATVLYGTVERPPELAQHLQIIRRIQRDTGGFTEFVPLAFIPFRTHLFATGIHHPPSLSYSLLVHAVARLVFAELIPNIQASWVKLGPDGASLMLRAGANDLGGTLMEEHITRATGGTRTSMSESQLRHLIVRSGRIPKQRTTLYGILD